MGIKHLWSILTPFCERKPLFELHGKTVAVDLSCWICEAQNIAEYQIQPRMYLRNLYFRTCYLLLLDVNPVFILEGKAPELKYETIAARNALQFKGAKPKADGIKTGKDRSKFNFILKRCQEMLHLMGLSCIVGKGEAESLCAYLNDEGLVDGCISQDSDCFAYGAKVVYRNFSVTSQGANKSSGGAVDIYDIAKANESMSFGRNKIIAMALFCGSDYGDGVHGIGKETVLKFFEDLSDEETLNRIRSWKQTPEVYEEYERLISDKNICTSCGHRGKINAHNKSGCGPCGMMKGCSDKEYKMKRFKIKNELQLRSKALLDPNFPNEDLIREFLSKKERISKLDLEWKKPNLVEFVRFTTKYLQWEEIYGFEKILPILTRWQCLNYENLDSEKTNGIVYPDYIKKIRNPKGVPSYEIIWSDPQGYFTNLIPKEQIEDSNTNVEELWSTIERQDLINKAYPELVETFQESKIKPKKSTRRRKKDATIEGIEGMMKNTSISEPKIKKSRKKKENHEKIQQQIKKPTVLDNFLKKAILKNHRDKNNLRNEIDYHTSTPCKSSTNLMDISRFGDEEDDSDLSDIIDNIISRKPAGIQENLVKLKDVVNLENEIGDKNSSSFFITGPVENDLFEKTFNEMFHCDTDSTVEYEYDKLEFSDDTEPDQKEDKSEENNEIVNEDIKSDEKDEYSFCNSYVPLIERIKKKM
ncbi:flap endonuclease GEN isoform X1 [Diorhabda sublineata]|uniref:flap endonuclease GEN isoform X1 n=1 Tax=Diorhabda sublineata TaxID=1163346 RepID=UPI0024E0904D|nr:flap endonuclease GEN isoform X1 [Diorhabda sublineata]